MKTTDNITLYSIPAVFSSCMSGHRTWGPLASADALFVAWYLGMPFPRCHPTGRAYRCCQRCSVETPVLRTASTECPQMTSTPCKSPSSVKWFQMYNVVNAVQNCCDMALPLHGRALRPSWARTISWIFSLFETGATASISRYTSARVVKWLASNAIATHWNLESQGTTS